MKTSKVLLLGFFLLLSAALRVYSIGKPSYWIDEMVSLHFATSSDWKSIFWDNNPFLYHWLLKEWVKLAGESEAWTRLLSVIFSVGTTGVLFFFGDFLAGLAGAVLFALLYCVYPVSIQYAQETRMYSLFELATAIHLFFLYRFGFQKKSKVAYLLSIIFLCLTQYLAAIPLLLEVIWFAAQKKDRMTVKWLGAGGAAAAAVFGFSYLNFFSWPNLGWQKFKYAAGPGSALPLRILWMWSLHNWLSAAGLVVLFAWSVRSMRREPVKYRDEFFFLFFPLGTLVLMWAAAMITARGIFVPRYFIFTVPFLVAWSALASLSLYEKHRFAAVTVLAFIVGGAAVAIPQLYVPAKSPWRDAARYVTSFPGSTGFTTRTAALKTPYFENHGVDVQKWEPTQDGLNQLLAALKRYQNVWMIENYIGGLQYFDRLKKRLNENGIEVEEKEFDLGKRAEPVLLLRAYHPSPRYGPQAAK